MSEDTSIRATNEGLARQFNREARADPNSPYAHKFVGIANGKVVVVADTWREVDLALEQAEPDPARCYAVDASADYDRVEVIWRVTDPCRASGRARPLPGRAHFMERCSATSRPGRSVSDVPRWRSRQRSSGRPA